MTDTQAYIYNLLSQKGLAVKETDANKLLAFSELPENKEAVNQIVTLQNNIMSNWQIRTRVADILAQPLVIPNGTVGKPYTAKIDFQQLQLTDLVAEKFEGLEQYGLSFNKVTDSIEGTPNQSGDLKFTFCFKVNGEQQEAVLNEKKVSLVINPDPKTLWKSLPSDPAGPFAKPDDVTVTDALGSKRVVVSSKRGRSHANVGSYRDDDFSYQYFDDTQWAVVAVSDGAGSYPLSRKGSEIACKSVVNFFELPANKVSLEEFEQQVAELTATGEDLETKLKAAASRFMYKITVFVHEEIKKIGKSLQDTRPELFTSTKAKTFLDYFHATLIYTLFKKYSFGYLVMSFGVGDCPIAMVSADKQTTTLLNWLDVGEYGGGTRFITQPDIFQKADIMPTRFNVKVVPDFAYLFLMTDGIYDAKFIVEANLEKNEKWTEFLADLNGNNEDNVKVALDASNKDITDQLSNWMDFWSQGNHDDRTLAIIF